MANSPIKRILAPVDLSSCSRSALEFACSLAVTCGASVDVLFVSGAASSQEANSADAAELRRFVASVPGTSGPVLAQRVESGDARERIVALAAGGFDAIVLGTHGRTGRPRSLAGSVAEGVVRTAPCPVITVREPR
jgi:nucleotide-binding universal stress UspA family protein